MVLVFEKRIDKTDRMLVHSVFFTLKEGLSEDQKAAFIEQVHTLGTIDTVRSIHVGTPAATPDRPVIQTNYDVGLTVAFDSIEGHDIYQEAQAHHDFIENNKDLWENVVIYDVD